MDSRGPYWKAEVGTRLERKKGLLPLQTAVPLPLLRPWGRPLAPMRKPLGSYPPWWVGSGSPLGLTPLALTDRKPRLRQRSNRPKVWWRCRVSCLSVQRSSRGPAAVCKSILLLVSENLAWALPKLWWICSSKWGVKKGPQPRSQLQGSTVQLQLIQEKLNCCRTWGFREGMKGNGV